MHGYPAQFWGKFKQTQETEESEWHPLAHHCVDVAACFQALLEVPLLRDRLARLGGLDDLEPAQVERLSVLAFLHDLGKLSIGFQYKIRDRNPFPAKLRGHTDAALALFRADAVLQARALQILDIEALVTWSSQETLMRLLLVSFSHHGKPLILDQPLELRADSVWRPRNGLDPLAGLQELMLSCRSGFPEAYAPGGTALPDTATFQHGFAGLVMLADWLGSNRAWFPFSKHVDDERWRFARERAREALRRIGLDVASARAALHGAGTEFSSVFGREPYAMQQAVGALELGSGPSLTILESETGSGKTEAALWHFLRLMHAGQVDGLYFALPTRTAAKQIYARVYKTAQSAFGGHAPPVVQAVPGDVRVDSRYPDAQLSGEDERWSDDADALLRDHGWATEHPKRFTSAAIAVGTIDQALLAALQVKHAHLRGVGLTRSLLVVDEVHASDPYMERLLRALLRIHAASGGHALLMSATLGSRSRTAYLESAAQSLDVAAAEHYPLLLHRRGAGPPERHNLSSHRNKSVALRPRPILADETAVAQAALESAAAGARVLVLRNTVRGAVETQRKLELLAGPTSPLLFRCAGQPTLHHSRFAKEDRQALDAALQDAFGVDGRSGAGIVVATQTVQQSLDVDFDVLFSDLCPMDVLLQRIGRLHRHPDRKRPPGFKSPACHVLVPAERDLTPLLRRGNYGLGSVYPDLRIIEATWRQFEANTEIAIPADNRRLVEQATHPDVLGAIATSLAGDWPQHGQEMEGERLAGQSAAQLNTLDWSLPFGDRGGAFAGDLGGRIATRLGVDDRLALFPQGVPGPFGWPVYEIRLPGHLCPGVAAETKAKVLETEPRLVFTFGKWRFAYDRLGLQRLEE